MNPLLVMLVVAALLIVTLAIIGARRGRRGHINPPSDYYNGDPLIHTARHLGGFGDGPGGGPGGSAG